jgi:outer membrane protein TolC
MVKLLAIILAFSAPALGKATITLSQKDVAERILKDGYKAKEINLTSQLTRLDLAKALSTYDLTFTNETYLQTSKYESFQANQNLEDQTWKSSTTLSKPFTSGTKLDFEYTRTTLSSTFALGTTHIFPAEQTQDLMGVTLTQSIWRNFFGAADRATVQSAEDSEKASELTRAVDLQNLVLDAIRAFWTAYVAQENFQESLNSRTRYEKLAEVVRKKQGLGYSNPGELSQILAELEGRNQNAKTASNDYLAAIANLSTLLKLPPDSEVQFVVEKQIPPIPNLVEKDIRYLRAVRAQQLKANSAKESSNAADWNNHPDLSLVGKYYAAGLEASANDSLAEMSSGAHPQYYMGFKFTVPFGSDLQGETALNARLKSEIELTKLNRTVLETKDSQLTLLRKVQASYAIAQSTQRQRELREKAAQELQRSYAQGRTEISILIQAINNFFAAEVAYSKAVGDYMTALNEWAALRDELIPEQENK